MNPIPDNIHRANNDALRREIQFCISRRTFLITRHGDHSGEINAYTKRIRALQETLRLRRL